MDQTQLDQKPTPPAIEFRNVSIAFDETPVLRDVSFVLPHGEMFALTGESGSGKSVLLHLAIGLLKPDEGHIFIEGQHIDELGEEELLAIRGGSIGIVFQEEALFSGMTVFENAAFRLTEHGWADDDIERMVTEVLEFVGMENDRDLMPEQLSGGMRRRVEIARALVGWPSVMLYDEPTNELDPIVAGEVLDLIIRARDVHQTSALYVTKELQDLSYLATRRAFINANGEVVIQDVREEQELALPVILLEDGQIAFQGTRREFETSAMPVVTRFTHPESGRVVVDFYVPDPWSKRRRPKEKIL